MMGQLQPQGRGCLDLGLPYCCFLVVDLPEVCEIERVEGLLVDS